MTIEELQDATDVAIGKILRRDHGDYPPEDVLGVALSAIHERLIRLETPDHVR